MRVKVSFKISPPNAEKSLSSLQQIFRLSCREQNKYVKGCGRWGVITIIILVWLICWGFLIVVGDKVGERLLVKEDSQFLSDRKWAPLSSNSNEIYSNKYMLFNFFSQICFIVGQSLDKYCSEKEYDWPSPFCLGGQVTLSYAKATSVFSVE